MILANSWRGGGGGGGGGTIADVLIISHEQGIIHRDIKPESVFLHRDLNNVQIHQSSRL